MRNIIIVGCLTIAPYLGLCQEVVSTNGETYTNQQGSLAYTIGEVVIETGSNQEHIVTQGFHQSRWSFVNINEKEKSLSLSIYPNPTQEKIHFKLESSEIINVDIFDMQGKLVLNQQVDKHHEIIELSQLKPGSYSLVASSAKERVKLIKLIKSN